MRLQGKPTQASMTKKIGVGHFTHEPLEEQTLNGNRRYFGASQRKKDSDH
jgi:hypothetical protein